MRSNMKQVWLASMTSLVVFACGGCAGGEFKAPAATLNQSATLSDGLPVNPMEWKIITSSVDTSATTTSTLYGNEIAVAYARSNTGQTYPNGAEIALVTWTQREDDRWFGAKIPDQVKSVEFAAVEGPDTTKSRGAYERQYDYEKYEGTPLRQVIQQRALAPDDRMTVLFSQRAAVMP
jgi:Cytochrome P460